MGFFLSLRLLLKFEIIFIVLLLLFMFGGGTKVETEFFFDSILIIFYLVFETFEIFFYIVRFDFTCSAIFTSFLLFTCKFPGIFKGD